MTPKINYHILDLFPILDPSSQAVAHFLSGILKRCERDLSPFLGKEAGKTEGTEERSSGVPCDLTRLGHGFPIGGEKQGEEGQRKEKGNSI